MEIWICNEESCKLIWYWYFSMNNWLLIISLEKNREGSKKKVFMVVYCWLLKSLIMLFCCIYDIFILRCKRCLYIVFKVFFDWVSFYYM